MGINKEKLKRYQKEKFENYKLVNELSINNNEAYINAKIDSIGDVISHFSIKKYEILTNDFASFLIEKASYISLEYPLVLQIVSGSFSSEDKVTLRDIVKKHFSLASINKETELKAVKRKSYFFLSAGIILFFLSILFNYITFSSSLHDILVCLFSFSIWQYAELTLFEQDTLKEEILKYKHLSNIRIVFYEENNKDIKE